MSGSQEVPSTRSGTILTWATVLTIVAFSVAHVVTLSRTGVPYVAPFSFIITCLVAWKLGMRAGLAWVALFQLVIPGVLTFLGVGVLVAFPDVRGFVLLMMASSAAAQAALAYLAARTRSLTEQLRDSHSVLRATNEELQSALSEVKELRGFLPICAWCKDIRDISGNWERLESYITRHSHATVTHALCPKCLEQQLRGVPM